MSFKNMKASMQWVNFQNNEAEISRHEKSSISNLKINTCIWEVYTVVSDEKKSKKARYFCLFSRISQQAAKVLECPVSYVSTRIEDWGVLYTAPLTKWRSAIETSFELTLVEKIKTICKPTVKSIKNIYLYKILVRWKK